MISDKTAARIIGALFLISTAGMATGSTIIGNLLQAPDYLGSLYENRTSVILGSLLMLINDFAVVGIAVVIFPILKRHNETIALTYLSARIIEGIVLIIGVISILALITISREYIKLDSPDVALFKMFGSVAINGNAHAFNIAMIILSIGSLPMCYLLFQTNLLPKWLAAWGLIGYLVLLVGIISTMFGYNIQSISFIPGGLFELFLPFWLFFKGFNTVDDSAFNTGIDYGADTAKTKVLKQAPV